VNLRQKIVQEIQKDGPIAFSRYMEMCLYDPEFGYYSRNAEVFGKAGDFYTSSDVHAVFGRLVARQFEEMWRLLGSPAEIEVLELGPGRGLFAQDVLDWSEKKFPGFFQSVRYSLMEGSRKLRERLRTTLSQHFATGKAMLLEAEESESEKERTGAGGSEEGARGSVMRRSLSADVPLIVFANEFFDALPVEVVSGKGTLRVGAQGDDFVEEWGATTPAEFDFLDRYGVHSESGDRTEVGLVAQRWISRVAKSLQKGFVIAIDYGYTREEQLAGRHLGTVMAYRQHSASANPYEAPGEQDITAHVNFTALGAAAEAGGMLSHKLRTQSQFLLGIGENNQFADAFEECRLPQERAKVALQLKHLVTPAGMGETFHVLVASKGIDAEDVERLSGLSFGK
jgi:SAM-dependent MidA family methyltransferase